MELLELMNMGWAPMELFEIDDNILPTLQLATE